ncbi:MAG: tetratricopeptide repeat protein [Bacteroidia bacterium]|nr:tetratricopeptide repeat protein [Bacteroidia bacterium]
MSGKNSSSKKSTEKKATPPASKPQTGKKLPNTTSGLASISKMTWIVGLIVVLVTTIVFSGVTKLHWTNWDDDEYVYENSMVMEGDYKAIFKEPVNNNYNPLPVAMFAWEWELVKDPAGEAKDPTKALEDKARLFHINNLWMHVLCTALVFILMLQMGLNPIWAGLAALLFGIHPLRVESVAWITERKDVMFGTFYVGALIAYLRFLDTKKWLFYGICMILFVLSLLSKIQAVSLPLSMIALDWYRSRKFNMPTILEKVPFFIGSAIIGYIGVLFLSKGETIDTTQTFGLFQRVALGFTSYCLYIVKAVVPYETCTFYPYPKAVTTLHYVGLASAIGAIIGAIFLRKVAKEVTFGLAFFSVNIIFLLQIVGAGSAFFSDRFTYIAYIGLFFALAMLAQRAVKAKPALMPVVAGIAGLWVLGSAVLTWQYVPAWQNTDTLWTDVMEKYPRKVVLAYVNRAQYLRRHSQYLRSQNKTAEAQAEFDRAFQDLTTAIELQPNYHLGYLNRGNIFFDRGEDDKALADYTKVLEILGPIDFNKRIDNAAAGALSNRGAIYSRKGMRMEALADLDLALKINPKDKNTWNNRAVTHFDMGNYTKAIADFTELLKYEPNLSGAVNARGVCYMRLGKWQESLADFNKAVQMDPKSGAFISNRAIAHANLGNKSAALADAQKAQALGQPMDPAFLQSLQQ